MEQLSKPEPFLMADHHGEDVILVRDALAECAIKNPLQHVADGHEFIDYLQGHGPYADRKKHPMPQLALIEWDLPRRSGLEILRWLRDQPQHSMLPIMVWTRAAVNEAELKEAYHTGLNGFFSKPEPGKMVPTVRLMFEFWKLAEKPLVRKR